MKRIYDFLADEKEPFVFFERSAISCTDGLLHVSRSDENGGPINLAPSGLLVLCLGPGTSITQDAAVFCAKHDLQIAFFRGGSNIHSFFMAGRYQNPISITNQVLLAQNHKLEVAKELLRYRLMLNSDKENMPKIEEQKTVQELLLLEARWHKDLYKKYIAKIGYKIDFKRDYDGQDVINERLNILNNCLYSVATAVVLSCSLSPSVGFIHGLTRRGGLAFDLADLFKNLLVFPLAFDPKTYTNKDLMYEFTSRLKNKNQKIIKKMIEISLQISENKIPKAEDLYVNNSVK